MPESISGKPLIAGSEDYYIPVLYDEDEDPASGQVTREAIDLSDASISAVHLLCWLRGPVDAEFPASPLELELSPIPDQVTFRGYSRLRWTPEFPTPGTLKIRCRISRSEGAVIYSQERYHSVVAL